MFVGSTKLPSNNEIELISEEIEKGLNDSTIIRKFLEKRVQIEEEYAKNLQKLCKSQPNLKKIGGITSAFAVMVESINQYSTHLLGIVQKINNDVNDPLNNFIKDLKSENKTYFSDGQDLAKERKSIFESLKNSKSNYDSVFKDPESDPSKIGIAEEEYREQIVLANKYEASFHNEKLPKIQNDIQRLETIRMQKMKTNLKKFINEFESSPVKFTTTLKESEDIINAIDTKRDIMAFVNFNKSINNQTPEFTFEACEKEKKKKGWRSTMSVLGINIGGGSGNNNNTNNSNNTSERVIYNYNQKKEEAHPNAVFSVHIAEVMQKQKSKYPDLDVPYVLVLLVNLIKQNGGFQTEGIFRIPGHSETISTLKKQLNSGDYNITETNVHPLASLLKLWLRDMPQPLIPDSLYDRSVNSETTEQITEIFKQLPSINQKIVTFIVSFLNELILEENVAHSKMNLDNIGMVFAPSFLRCTNPEQLLANVEKEKSFIKTLIESYPSLSQLCPLNLDHDPIQNNSNQNNSNQNNSNGNNGNSNNSVPIVPIVHLSPLPPNKPLPPSSPLPKLPPSLSNSTGNSSTPPQSPPPQSTPPQSPPPIHLNNPVLISSKQPVPPQIPSTQSANNTPPLVKSGSSINVSIQSSTPIPTPILPKTSQSSLNLSSSGGSGSASNSPNLIKKTVKPVLPPPTSLAQHIHGSLVPTTSNPLLQSSVNIKETPEPKPIDPEILKTLKGVTGRRPSNADFKSSLPPPPPVVSPDTNSTSNSPTTPTSSPGGSKIFLNKFQLPPPPSMPNLNPK